MKHDKSNSIKLRSSEAVLFYLSIHYLYIYIHPHTHTHTFTHIFVWIISYYFIISFIMEVFLPQLKKKKKSVYVYVYIYIYIYIYIFINGSVTKRSWQDEKFKNTF